MYSAPHHIVGASDYIYGTCEHRSPYVPIKYLAFITPHPSVVGIYVYGIHLAIPCEVAVAVGCVLAYICETVRSFTHWDVDSVTICNSVAICVQFCMSNKCKVLLVA